MKKKEVLEEISLLENEKRQRNTIVERSEIKAAVTNFTILLGVLFVGALGIGDLVGATHIYAYGFALGVVATFVTVISTQSLVKIKIFKKDGLKKLTP